MAELSLNSLKLKTDNHTHDYNTLNNLPVIPTIPESLPANGGNSDTVGGKSASDFADTNHTHDLSQASVKNANQADNSTQLEGHNWKEILSIKTQLWSAVIVEAIAILYLFFR